MPTKLTASRKGMQSSPLYFALQNNLPRIPAYRQCPLHFVNLLCITSEKRSQVKSEARRARCELWVSIPAYFSLGDASPLHRDVGLVFESGGSHQHRWITGNRQNSPPTFNFGDSNKLSSAGCSVFADRKSKQIIKCDPL